MATVVRRGLMAAGWLLVAGSAFGQTGRPLVVHGEVSALVDVFPKQDNAHELRARVRVDATADPRDWLRVRLEGVVDGLVADRSGRVNDADVSVREAWTEFRFDRIEVRAGVGRLVWGRLDEVMPSDVINPIDTAAFFLEGRSEARLPVAFVRTRLFLPADTRLELVGSLPGSRSRFDRLDERSSPFNLLSDVVLPAGVPTRAGLVREEPVVSWANLQGGARLSTTVRRVDVSASAYRGVEGFGVVGFETQVESGPVPAVVGQLVERYPRFTMLAADAEMVLGPWAVRAEVAGFTDKTLSGPLGPVDGKAFDAGVGLDRSVGSFRVFGSAVWHREWSPTQAALTRSDVNVIGSVERRFSRERHLVRLFGVANPADQSGFVRGVWSWSVRDNVTLDGSGGLFLGAGSDSISRFVDRDFAFLRVRYLF